MKDTSEIDQVRQQMAVRLKEERLAAGLSPDEAAAAGRVSRATQYDYEGGGRVPDVIYLRWLDLAGLDVLYVLTGRRLKTEAKISPAEAELVERHRKLPPKLQQHVNDAALLAWLVFQDRKGYHAFDGDQGKVT